MTGFGKRWFPARAGFGDEFCTPLSGRLHAAITVEKMLSRNVLQMGLYESSDRESDVQ